MAGMYSGADWATKPEVTALEDGTMPETEPLAETDKEALKWAKETVKEVDAAKEAEEDRQDE